MNKYIIVTKQSEWYYITDIQLKMRASTNEILL